MEVTSSALVTTHSSYNADARTLSMIPSESVNLVVTSPPYPMIQMWDSLFSTFSSETNTALSTDNSNKALESMHRELDKVWYELFRVLKPGSFACINIGDATRTIGGNFALYANHARITSACTAIGFSCLPGIIWSKTSNAPNKFMGSGMLPAGAYVTLEHEHILIFRKGSKRAFITTAEKQHRMESAYFWEERNSWFSNIWNLTGVKQRFTTTEQRERSAAFPLELAWRLINMYSLYGDTVLDPFGGTGTTQFAALASARNSIGIDCDPSLAESFIVKAEEFIPQIEPLIATRFKNHTTFVETRIQLGKALKYHNPYLNTKVITRQETGIIFKRPDAITKKRSNTLTVSYSNFFDF